MKSTEEVLSGGNINKVVKKGDILYREIKGSPMVHQYLAYLEKVGMTGVPRFLGIDSQNREMLSFLPGQTMGNPLPPYASLFTSDDTLIAIARFMKKLHAVSEGFLPTAKKHQWASSLFNKKQWETICHNDAALWNFVFSKTTVIGLFDFDTACPGPRLWDIALTLYSLVPLTPHEPDSILGKNVPYQTSKHRHKRQKRIQLFFNAYGIPCPKDCIPWSIRRIQVDFCDYMTKGAAKGDENAIRMIREGHLAYYQKVLSFMKEHEHEWT